MSESIESLISQAAQLAAEKRFPECAEMFSKAFELSPGDPDALRILAKIMVDIGQDQVALSLMADSINVENPDSATLRRMANLLRGLDRTDEAADLLICAAAADPENTELRGELEAVLSGLGRSAELEQYLGSGEVSETK
jgi:thioredoxin-like negative regulator of GroEL